MKTDLQGEIQSSILLILRLQRSLMLVHLQRTGLSLCEVQASASSSSVCVFAELQQRNKNHNDMNCWRLLGPVHRDPDRV